MLSDIRVACRTLARRAVFSVSTTLMLAVAIAGGLVVHALADAVLFRSYPFPQPERLVVDLCARSVAVGEPRSPTWLRRCSGGRALNP